MKPTNPESNSQNQLCALASNGRTWCRKMPLKIVNRTKANTSRIKLTCNEPMRLLAASNDSEVNDQQMAVVRAANSPKWVPVIFQFRR